MLRLDSIIYDRQKKVINDTAYEYTVVRTLVYKTGSFLNAQNDFYNKTYGGDDRMLFYTLTVAKSGKSKKRKPAGKSGPKLFAVNYNADQLYFSREELNVEHTSYTFHGVAINPGEEALAKYVPEHYAASATRRSALPSENYVEPSYMRRSMSCGYSQAYLRETTVFQAVHYSYTQNSKGLRDACYHDSGGEKGLMYSFTYQYFE
ncbi:MAG: hypothetical protein EOP49_42250 [Sphingobacteriales bacterium]|nr:MAG: hypothetical protein EOP49_42250 [Sphingobacteriales bacterium]